MFYVQGKGNKSPRELIMSDPNLQHYKDGIELAKGNDYRAVNEFLKVYGIGHSFMGKHAQFWSNFSMVILDQKIAGTLGYKTPQLLISLNTYNEFMNHINIIRDNNELNNSVEVERALFAFHSNYFDNSNTRFRNGITDYTDQEYANCIAQILDIN